MRESKKMKYTVKQGIKSSPEFASLTDYLLSIQRMISFLRFVC